MKISLLISFLLTFVSPVAWSQSDKRLSELIGAEKNFAATSETKDTKTAFLENLAEDGILFRRGIVNGKQFWQGIEPQGKLTWEPQFADISAGGDFGYTTGPFKQFQNRSDEQPAGTGHYLSVWQKSNGAWKVLFDGGIGHPANDLSTWEKSSTIRTGQKQSQEVVKKEIAELENKFIQSFSEKGMSAFESYLSREARLYRPQKPPYRKDNQKELFSETDKKFTYEAPAGIQIATYGDMAFTYGNVGIEITRDGNVRALKGNYLRIWKHEAGKEWRIVIDMVSI